MAYNLVDTWQTHGGHMAETWHSHSRQTAGTQPPLHYPPAFQFSSTTVFSPTSPPSLPGNFSSRSGSDSDPSADNFLDQQGSREQEAPEADFDVVYNDLPPSYDIAMQDED